MKKVFISEKDTDKAAYVFTLMQILKDADFNELMKKDIGVLASECQSYGCGKFLDFILEQSFSFNGVNYYSESLAKNEEELKQLEVQKA